MYIFHSVTYSIAFIKISLYVKAGIKLCICYSHEYIRKKNGLTEAAIMRCLYQQNGIILSSETKL